MRKTGVGLSVLACFVAAFCAACSDSGGGGSLAALGVDDGASKGVSKSATVSGKEDVRIALKTGALMDVPAGAVSKNVELTMERPADTKAVELVERFKKMQDRIVSAPYVLTPHGTKFQQEVTLTLPLAKTGKKDVSVAWLENEDDTEWKFLGKAKTNTAGTKAEVKIKHFSVVVIVEEASDLEPVDDISKPVSDGGAGLDASQPDASVDPGSDAGVGTDAGDDAPLDAGRADAGGSVVDAGGRFDAMQPQDTGTQLPEGGGTGPDAGVKPDAGAISDGGPGVPPVDGAADADADADTGTPSVDNQYADLLTCEYITGTGNFSAGGLFGVGPFLGPRELCYHSCVSLAGTCNDVQINRCNIDVSFSQPVYDCWATCPLDYGTCPDNANFSAYACNGVPECPSGVDEQGCDPQLFFTCQGNERVSKGLLCDTIANCSNAADEQSCFFCDGSSTRLAPYRVCDGWIDCADGLDEQGCAQIDCSPRID